MTLAFNQVAIIGAGAMGRGIAQIAAQSGSQVWFFDTQTEATQLARDAVFQVWETLMSKGRFDADTLTAYKSRIHMATTLHDLRSCELVIEAIVERLDTKKNLFIELENNLARFI
jgi:3-hydroxybutyryl-CoA dehydrogenase